jgi:hypothetical protein
MGDTQHSTAISEGRKGKKLSRYSTPAETSLHRARERAEEVMVDMYRIRAAVRLLCMSSSDLIKDQRLQRSRA